MNRRQLLAGALASAAILTTPHLALAGVTPQKRRRLLKSAFATAEQRQRPLMVLIIPDDVGWSRGQRLGIWLNNGEDEDLAPLARVEVACAKLGEVAELVPGVENAHGAWMILVQAHQPVPTWRSVIVPAVPDELQPKSYEDFAAEFTKRHGKKPNWGKINRAFQEHQQAVAAGRLEAEIAAFRGSIGRVLTSEGLVGGDTRALAEQARERWVKAAPAGAHWASAGGCGTYVEPNPGDDANALNRSAMLCGMGHVEAYERRFLHFWARS